ncbi:MAG: hypothetical protein ACI80S_000293 [Pseudohongiellaceae bacterium]|jgi:hypothetical protein
MSSISLGICSPHICSVPVEGHSRSTSRAIRAGWRLHTEDAIGQAVFHQRLAVGEAQLGHCEWH